MTMRALFSAVLLMWGITIGLTSAPAPLSPLPAAGSLLPGPAAPASISQQVNDDCLACHDDPEAKAEDGRAVVVVGSRYAESVHGGLEMDCTACHTDLDGVELPHEPKLQKVDCSTCHEEAVAAYDSSIHAAARRKDTGSVAATCVDCHTVHYTRASTDPDSTT
jgi:hypothetical protein